MSSLEDMRLAQSPFSEIFNKVLRSCDVFATNLFDGLILFIATEAHKIGVYKFLRKVAAAAGTKTRGQKKRGRGSNSNFQKPSIPVQQN